MKNNLLNDKLSYNGEESAPTSIELVTYSSSAFSTTAIQGSIQTFISQKSETYWLRVDGLSEVDRIQALATDTDINFLLLQDILNCKHPSKIEEYDSFVLLILKYFLPDEEEGYIPYQISLVLGENYLITFTEKKHPFMDDIFKAIQADVLRIRERGADYLLSVMVNSIVANYTSVVLTITDALDDLEDELLAMASTQRTGSELQNTRKQYLKVKKAVLPLKEQYARLFRVDGRLISKRNKPFFNDVNDHLQFVLQNIEICRETLASLVDLYISNNDLKMNDIMKRLTIVSTIFIPLTFLVGVWGMNFSFMPELNWKYGYLGAWVLMLIIGLVIYFYFKIKKWY